MIKNILKFAVAFALLYWLFQSGKIDLSLLADSLDHPGSWAAYAGIQIFNILVSAYRWKLILKIKSTNTLPYPKVVKLTWIGLLFNTVLPGAVTGDLIKLVYARDLDRKLPKTFLLMSAFTDRLFGLFGLLILLGLCSAIFYNDIIAISPKLKSLVSFNFLVFAAMIVFFISFFIHQRVQNVFLNLAKKLPFIGEHAHKTLVQIWDIGRDKKTVTTCVLLSVMTQFLNITSFWILIGPFLDAPLSYAHAFSFIPLGLVTIAIPISPAGLGVGHAAFDTLFRMFGVGNGASLFNFSFIGLMIVNLLGIIPYLTTNKHNLEEVHQFDDAVN